MEAVKCINYEAQVQPWIETYTGKHFHLLDPQQDEIDIVDIAHALSHACRFGGHVLDFYSVAEHSVHVSRLTGNLEGLLHDASEAYIADIVSPLKPHLTNYKEIEETIMWAIAKKFHFIWPMTPDTKDADTVQLKTEAYFLLPSQGKDWVQDYPTKRRRGRIPLCWTPAEAKQNFLQRYYELTDNASNV